MSNTELVFERPFLLFLLIPALAIVLVPFFLLPKRRRNRAKRIIPLVLHSLCALLLVLIISGMTFVTTSSEQSMILLLDLSDSTDGMQTQLLSEAREIFGLLENDMPVKALAFGGNSLFDVSLDRENEKILAHDGEFDASDLEEALTQAADRLPGDTFRRVVLLSDGKQTDGSAMRAAVRLASRGVRVDTVCYDPTSLLTGEVQLSEVTAPASALNGAALTVNVRIDSLTECTATLTVTDNGVAGEPMEVLLLPGVNNVAQSVVPKDPGMHVFDFTIESDADTLEQNNAGSVSVEVRGEPAVLVIAGSLYESAYFRRALTEKYAVTAVISRNAPKTVAELCKYDEVILLNVDAADLPTGYDKVLDTYVSIYGRSLLTLGGENTYSFGNMQDTGYEDLLPVSLSYDRTETNRAVALMLVIDCSRSMASSGSQNFATAKQGAMKCVAAMSERDYVGIISFSTAAQVESSLLLATDENKQEMNRAISNLQIGSGTYYTEALRLAHEELLKSDAPVKHIIFLSDGQPSDNYQFYDEAERIVDDDITVSTIGLGFYSYALPEIADICGGRYYYAANAEDLPDVMLSEAQMVAVSALVIGKFEPVVSRYGPLTLSLGDEHLPILSGYIGTKPKEGAAVYLVSDEGDPIYAEWSYGLGKVASFMSDVGGTWSWEWVNDAIAKGFMGGMVETTVPEGNLSTSLTVRVEQFGKSARLVVETYPDETCSLEATVTRGDNQTDCTLEEVNLGIFSADFDTPDRGIYNISVTMRDENGVAVDHVDAVHSVSYKKEYDLFSEQGRPLLENISRVGGGVLLESGADKQPLADAEPEVVRYTHSLTVPLGIAALVLLLVDIAFRKLRLQDIKRFFSPRKA